MLNSKRWKKYIEKEEKKSSLFNWIQQQLSKCAYNLNDSNCIFFIKDVLEEKGQTIIVQLYIKPQVGIFEEIEFRPKLYFCALNFQKRPKIYNDRRLFHPNINLYTLEIVYPQLIKEWNPTHKQISEQLSLINYFQLLKKIILYPNISFVPNNPYNRKAAWHYHFDKSGFRDLIIRNCPAYLQNIISNELSLNLQQKMDIQEQKYQQHNNEKEDQFWALSEMTARKRTPCQIQKYDQDGENLEMLTKKIKFLDFDHHETTQSNIQSQQDGNSL